MDYYRTVADSLLPDSKFALKTDCFNETHEKPIIYREEDLSKTTLLEYNPEHIKLAREKIPNLRVFQGDIRRLIEWEAQTFDLLLEFSTIDHVPQSDVPIVLDGYNHVLMPGSKAVIITWFNGDGYKDEGKGWNSTDQYFFDFEFVKSEIEKRFKIVDEATILDDTYSGTPPKCFLYEFRLEKK